MTFPCHIEPATNTSLNPLIFWMDASDAASRTLSGNNVTVINDKSPNAATLTPYSTYIAATVDVAAQNGLDSFRFNNSAYQSTVTLDLSGGYSFVGVIKVLNAEFGYAEIFGSSVNTARTTIELSTDFASDVNSSGGLMFGLGAPALDGTYAVYSTYIDAGGTVGKIYLNGVDKTESVGPYTQAFDLNAINLFGFSNTSPSLCWYAEAKLWSGVRGDTALLADTSSVMTKWSIV